VTPYTDPSSSPELPALRFGAIVLAAGASVRMREPKQLLPITGQPLIVRTIEAALASAAWPVVVVVGAHAEKIRPLLARYPVLIAENAAWIEGMASSLRTGVATLQQFSRSLNAALVALCDQPAFSAQIVAQLVSTQRQTGRSIVAARYNGRNGAPALFLREHFAALATLTGEAGARDLLNSAPEQIAAVELPEMAADLDTPADYARYKSV
jgi:molybdenum cofactor cytidylyltransferase